MSGRATLAALLAIAAGATIAVPLASAGDKPMTTIGVRNGASEFSFSLSRSRVDPGPALVQYQNTGEDPHDVKIQRRGADDVLAIGVTEPGGVGSVAVDRLKADSKYDLWCSLEGHREAGMEATLKVKKKKRQK